MATRQSSDPQQYADMDWSFSLPDLMACESALMGQLQPFLPGLTSHYLMESSFPPLHSGTHYLHSRFPGSTGGTEDAFRAFCPKPHTHSGCTPSIHLKIFSERLGGRGATSKAFWSLFPNFFPLIREGSQTFAGDTGSFESVS